MKPELFVKMMPFVYQWEGKSYEDDPDDAGGATKFGIDFRSLNDFSKTKFGANFLLRMGVALPLTKSSIKNLNEDQATEIYFECYWQPVELWNLDSISCAVAFDTAINVGERQAAKFVQRAVGGCYPDGIVGTVTRYAVGEYISKNGDKHLAKAILERRRVFYKQIAQKANNKKFLKGWLNRCDALERFLGL